MRLVRLSARSDVSTWAIERTVHANSMVLKANCMSTCESHCRLRCRIPPIAPALSNSRMPSIVPCKETLLLNIMFNEEGCINFLIDNGCCTNTIASVCSRVKWEQLRAHGRTLLQHASRIAFLVNASTKWILNCATALLWPHWARGQSSAVLVRLLQLRVCDYRRVGYKFEFQTGVRP
jgi:hypothetical protein